MALEPDVTEPAPLVVFADDGRAHRRAGSDRTGTLTACGKRRIGPPDALADTDRCCHECLPTRAHPLAAIWAACDRWDAAYNAATGPRRP